ncbi:MAG: hypothetical protein LLG09_02230 [Negativicutes bacterium]|nr:hypothetical protein [Negativicutes bacterium]
MPHSSNYEIEKPDLACIVAAKMRAMTIVDLLTDGAANALKVKAEFKARMTKEHYRKEWRRLNL